MTVTKYDPLQCLKFSYDESKKALRVSGSVTSVTPVVSWGFQDFTAGSITSTTVNITNNQNGTGYTFDVTKMVNDPAGVSTFIVLKSDLESIPYTGTNKLFSSKVEVNANSSGVVTLSGIPNAVWGDVRIYYMYKYDAGFPTDYEVAPKFMGDLDELGDLFLSSVKEDPNPKLGADLDVNLHSIVANAGSVSLVNIPSNSSILITDTGNVIVNVDPGLGGGYITLNGNIDNPAILTDGTTLVIGTLTSDISFSNGGAITNGSTVVLSAPSGIAINKGTNAYTLPTSRGTSGQVLSTNGAGVTTWVNQSGGGVTSITAGTGLTGGTITSTGTVALATTTVTAGSYTSANITVDAFGRITSASNGTGGGGSDATALLYSLVFGG